ncbi:MAG: thiamine phosphate synthase [Flavisolibacter sp.]
MFSKLQYISQGATAKDQLNNIKEVLNAGCEWIQLRFKNADEQEINTIGIEVKKICTSFNAAFIINDHPHIAKEIDSDGVHLGLKDMPVNKAREILGDKIIGGTANTLEDALKRVHEGCSYIGLGPFRFTETKEKLSPILGLEGYKNIMSGLKEHKIQLPVYAIGGIVPEDIESLMQTGVYGVAVSGCITYHKNKTKLINEINLLLL